MNQDRTNGTDQQSRYDWKIANYRAVKGLQMEKAQQLTRAGGITLSEAIHVAAEEIAATLMRPPSTGAELESWLGSCLNSSKPPKPAPSFPTEAPLIRLLPDPQQPAMTVVPLDETPFAEQRTKPSPYPWLDKAMAENVAQLRAGGVLTGVVAAEEVSRVRSRANYIVSRAPEYEGYKVQTRVAGDGDNVQLFVRLVKRSADNATF